MTASDLKDARATIRALLQDDEAARAEIRKLLPRRQAACVEMYYYGEWTQLQIGERLGISDRTVRSDLRQALETIAQTTSFLNSFPLFPLFPACIPDDLLD